MDYLPVPYEELLAVWKRNNEDFKDILAAIPKSQRVEFLEKTVDERGKTIAHILAQDGNLDCLIEALSEEDLYKLLACKTKGYHTAFHFAAIKNHEYIFSSVAKALSFSQHKLLKLLTAQDKIYGRTVLHFIAEWGSTDSLITIVPFFDSSFLYQLLEIRDQEGLTVLHWSMRDECLGPMRCIKEKLSQLELYNLLAIPNNSGATALHWAAMVGCREMFELVSTGLSKDDYQSLLLTADKNDCSVIHSAMKNKKHQKLVKDLLEALPTNSLSQLLLSQTSDEEIPTAMHYLAKFGLYEEIMEYIVTRFISRKAQLFKFLAKQTKETRETPLHFAAWAGQLGIFKCLKLLESSEKKLIPLLSIKDSENYTVLHHAARLGHVDIVEYIAESLPNDDLLELILQTELSGNSVLHCVAECGGTGVLLALFANLTSLQKYEILTSLNGNALTAYHLALQRNNQEIADCLKSSMDEILTDVEGICCYC